MKKLNNKGFMLTETMVVAMFILVTLVVLYSQFTNVYNGYNKSFTYNTTNGLYATSNIRDYIYKDGIDKIVFKLKYNNSPYVDITNCSTDYFIDTSYCSTLLNILDVNQVIFTYSNLSNVKNNMTGLSVTMMDFINGIEKNSDSLDNIFRIIVKFNDDTYTTLKVYR